MQTKDERGGLPRRYRPEGAAHKIHLGTIGAGGGLISRS